MGSDRFVAAHYQGLSLGRGLQMDEFGGHTAFLHHPSPMPVGSSLIVEAEDTEMTVKVTKVGEQIAGTERGPGMFVEAVDLSEKARTWWVASGDQAAPEDSDSSEEAPLSPDREFARTEVMEAVVIDDTVVSAPSQPEPAQPEPAKKTKGNKKKRRRKKK